MLQLSFRQPALSFRCAERKAALAWSLRLLPCVALLACAPQEKLEDWREPAQSSKHGPAATAPDRLPPGELLEGPDSAFGLPVPKGMELSHPAPKVAHFVGRADFARLTDYVRERVTVRHAELRKGELVFPSARIKGGDPDKVFDVSLRDRGSHAAVLIIDRTKRPLTPGLTSEERWKRVGLKPGGGLIDPHGME